VVTTDDSATQTFQLHNPGATAIWIAALSIAGANQRTPPTRAGSPQHRVRVWPLADRAGAPMTGSYLLGCEEATNGDYRDYLFVLSNVKPAP
jgi:hypothetical protein